MKVDDSQYTEKVNELNFFINSLLSLYKITDEKKNPYTFYLNEMICDKNFELDSFLIILKSNSFLMMYNIIESTVKYLIECLYNEINTEKLKYIDVSSEFKKIWFKYQYKNLNGSSSPSKYKETSAYMIESILTESILEFDQKNISLSGNADLQVIKKLFVEHGIKLEKESVNKFGSKLQTIKDRRNSLAHGSESFIQSAKDYTPEDIQNYSVDVINFLDYLFSEINRFLSQKKYQSQ